MASISLILTVLYALALQILCSWKLISFQIFQLSGNIKWIQQKETLTVLLWLAEMKYVTAVKRRFIAHYRKDAPPRNSINN